jgi:hypothetical protein
MVTLPRRVVQNGVGNDIVDGLAKCSASPVTLSGSMPASSRTPRSCATGASQSSIGDHGVRPPAPPAHVLHCLGTDERQHALDAASQRRATDSQRLFAAGRARDPAPTRLRHGHGIGMQFVRHIGGEASL